MPSNHFETELRYRTLLEEASDGIVVFDDSGRFMEANPSLCAMLGYSRDEVLSMDAASIIHPQDLEREPIGWEALKAGLVRIIERRFVRKDGSIVPVETKTRRMQDGRYLSIVRDITARRQADQALTALREREEQLRQAQKIEAIGRLAGGVAHDFNNVLTAIMGYTDLLLDDFREDDPRRQDLKEIKKAGERAAGLTRQLLAFSRKQVLQPVMLDLNAIVGGVDKLLRRLLGDEIEFHFAPDAALRKVIADPGQVEQVLINLSVNARDAMADGGRLTVRTQNVRVSQEEAQQRPPMIPGLYVTLMVADTGHGIEPDVAPHIFEPFFTTKAQGKGTGLGLATVYGIVKQSDGFVFVDSQPGQGAAFTVYLPAAEETPADTIDGGDASAHPVVLVVEDEPAVRALAAGVLRRQPVMVLEAASASEALHIARQHQRLDLLLTDIVMPGGGHELARELRRERPQLKVIYMSGYSDENVRQAAAREGIPFVQKPFTPHALVKVVSDALRTSA